MRNLKKGVFFMTKFYIPKTRKIVITALLLAVYMVLDRVLTVNFQTLKINFSTVAVAMTAFILGPAYSVILAVLGDLIGALTMPFGAFFPGFTLSAALSRINIWVVFI